MTNIVYTLDSSTGLMKLKFKENILDGLDKSKQESFLRFIVPLLTMNEKFVLTGSLSLKLLGFEPMDDIGDFDLGLMDNLTEEEFNTIKNFFGFTSTGGTYMQDEENSTSKFDPKARMWQLIKYWNDNEVEDETVLTSPSFLHNVPNIVKIDIFNDEILRKRDIISVWFDDFEIKLVQPSITWSYRMRYALDPRSGSAYKYWNRVKDFMDNTHKHYYTTIRTLNNMIMRVHEHNTNVEGDKEKINKIRNLINQREWNIDGFIDQILKIGETKT